MAENIPSTPGFVNSNFYILSNVQKFESPITKVVQRAVLSGGLWMASYSLPKMKRIQAAPWRAFFALLEGSANTFNAYDPENLSPQGVATGTPLVNGGSQTGSSLVTDGWTASTTNILMAGDYIKVNGELKMVTSNVNSDSGGNATINIKPALRNSPSDDDAITVNNLTIEMFVLENDITSWEIDKNGIYLEKTFSAMESIS